MMKPLLATLLSLSLPAMAAVSSSATVRDLGYELIDLRPDDGIAPGFTIMRSLFGNTSLIIAQTVSRYRWRGASVTDDDPHHPLSLNILNGGAMVDVGMSWTGRAIDMHFEGAAQTLPDATTNYGGIADTMAYGLTANLTPHTLMRWTGDYTLDAAIDGKRASIFDQTAFAKLEIYLGESQDPMSYQVEANLFRDQPTLRAHQEGSFSFDLRNDSGDSQNLFSRLGMYVYGNNAIPVSEVSSALLMLAGLGAIGAIRGGRGRQRG